MCISGGRCGYHAAIHGNAYKINAVNTPGPLPTAREASKGGHGYGGGVPKLTVGAGPRTSPRSKDVRRKAEITLTQAEIILSAARMSYLQSRG
jgi:hypothetical protein